MTNFISVSVWIFLVIAAGASEPMPPDAIYRFERSSLEKLNLVDGLGWGGTPCSFTRQESDGSISRVIVFSDELANYLATLQMPSVMLTFKYNPSNRTPYVATIHGKPIGKFSRTPHFIRKEDQKGKVLSYLH